MFQYLNRHIGNICLGAWCIECCGDSQRKIRWNSNRAWQISSVCATSLCGSSTTSPSSQS